MARALTKAQIRRRTLLVECLLFRDIATAAELRQFLAGRRHIYVTVDTVGRDLRAMEEAGTVQRRRHLGSSHEWGGGRRIYHVGWSITPAARRTFAPPRQ